MQQVISLSVLFLLVFLSGCSAPLHSPSSSEGGQEAEIKEVPKALDTEITKKKKSEEKAFLGIAHRVVDLSTNEHATEKTAYQITFIIPDSAAQRAGLLKDDFILRYDDISLDSITTSVRQSALRNYLFEHKSVGEHIDLKIMRYESLVLENQGQPTSIGLFDWESFKNHGGKKASQKIEIQHDIKIFNTTAVLGKRVDRELDSLPVPEEVLPQYANLSTGVLHFVNTVIEEQGLQGRWEDFKLRHARDELWQGLEDGMCRYDHFQYMRLRPLKSFYVARAMAQEAREKANPIELMQAWLINRTDDQQDGGINKLSKLSPWQANTTMDDWMKWLTQSANTIGKTRNDAFSALSQAEQRELSALIDGVMKRFGESFYINYVVSGERPVDQMNRRFFELALKVDFQQLYQAGVLMTQLYDKEMLQAIKAVVEDSSQSVYTAESAFGRIIVAGSENNQHRHPAAILIDTGGDEQYLGANQGGEQAVAITIDMSGNDRYWATRAYSLGGAKMAVSAVIDLGGNDSYIGREFSQAASVLGVGMLIDESGDDRYLARRYGQGTAFMGIAVLKDFEGDDEYHADTYSQGLGGVCAVGFLHDLEGDDRYIAGLEKPSSYGTSGHFQGASQGVGIGFRGYSRGGYGLLVDESGDDSYEVGNFGMGTGYFFGLGMLVDKEGDDIYNSARYGLAASAHSAVGVVIEGGGDDEYLGNHIAANGAAWDLSFSFFYEGGGDDKYGVYQYGFSKGAAAHNGFAVMFDEHGDDEYFLDSDKVTLNDYHGGDSFAFRFDFDGDDKYLNEGGNDRFSASGQYRFSIDWHTRFSTDRAFSNWLGTNER